MSDYRPRLNGEGWEELITLAKTIGPEKVLEKIDTVNTELDFSQDQLNITDSFCENLDHVVKKYNINTAIWKANRPEVNEWQTHFKDNNGEIVSRINKQFKVKFDRINFDITEQESYIENWIRNLSVAEVPSLIKSTESEETPIYVVISDLHLGTAYVSDIQNAEYNDEIAIERLSQIAQRANKQNRPVVVFCLGDLIESFTGLNHINSWKGISSFGVDVAFNAFDILRKFLAQIEQLKSFHLISGNHDRVTSNRELDTKGQVAKMIYELFKRIEPGLNIEFNPLLISAEFEDICFIMSHGDKKITKIKPEELAFRFGNRDKYNVVLSGHFHERVIQKDRINLRSYIVPSVMGMNDYAEENGYFSSPGYYIFFTENKKLNVLDIEL